jgi:hypothetical protein
MRSRAGDQICRTVVNITRMRVYVHTVIAHAFGSDAADTGKCYDVAEVATRFSEHLDGRKLQSLPAVPDPALYQ